MITLGKLSDAIGKLSSKTVVSGPRICDLAKDLRCCYKGRKNRKPDLKVPWEALLKRPLLVSP